MKKRRCRRERERLIAEDKVARRERGEGDAGQRRKRNDSCVKHTGRGSSQGRDVARRGHELF